MTKTMIATVEDRLEIVEEHLVVLVLMQVDSFTSKVYLYNEVMLCVCCVLSDSKNWESFYEINRQSILIVNTSCTLMASTDSKSLNRCKNFDNRFLLDEWHSRNFR